MRRQRTFRPTGDCLETRDVPAAFGVASKIAQVPHAVLASRLNTPFAGTLRLGTGTAGHQLSFSRTTTIGAGAFNSNLGLNRLAASLSSNLGANITANQVSALLASGLGTNQGTPLTGTQLTSLLNQLNAGSRLGTSSVLNNALLANLTNRLRANATNPNLASLLGTTPTPSLLNSGVSFPATLSSQSFGFGTGTGLNGLFGSLNNGFGLNSLLGSQFGNTSLLNAGMGFANFM